MKKLLFSAALVALLCAEANAQQTYQIPAGILPGHTVVGAPVVAPITFTGSISVYTVGSYTVGTLSVNAPANASPPFIPAGSVITGTGVTAGTVVMGAINANTYSVTTTGGTIAAVSGQTLTATPKLSFVVQDTIQSTPPAYSAGGCTVGPSFSAASIPFAWTFTNGSATCTLNTVTFTFPAAPVSWNCTATDTTNPNTHTLISTGAASTTAVVFTDYSPAGVAQPTGANDVIVGTCLPH